MGKLKESKNFVYTNFFLIIINPKIMSKDRNHNYIDRNSFTKQNNSITLIARYEKKLMNICFYGNKRMFANFSLH